MAEENEQVSILVDKEEFMCDEYTELDKVGILSVDNSSLNQANILQELKNHQEQMAERMEQRLKINMIEILTGLCGQLQDIEDVAPPQATVHNLAQPNLSDNAMFQLRTSLQNKVEELSKNQNKTSNTKLSDK